MNDNNWSYFSKPTQNLIQKSYQEALDHQHPQVTCEHVLIHLLNDPQVEAYYVLKALIAHPHQLEEEIRVFINKRQYQSSKQKFYGNLGDDLKLALNQAIEFARLNRQSYVTSKDLLWGILQVADSWSGLTLYSYGVTQGVIHRLHGPVKEVSATSKPKPASLWATLTQNKIRFIPFIILFAFIFIMAYALSGSPDDFTLYVFFIFGAFGVIHLLHETAHAWVAYWAGDKELHKTGYLFGDFSGYSSFSHHFFLPFLSLVFLRWSVYLFPGFINFELIPNRNKRLAVIIAGPICSLILLIITGLIIQFTPQRSTNLIWAGINHLFYLQMIAFFFNCLPLPGQDGFFFLKEISQYFGRIVKEYNEPSFHYTILTIILFSANQWINPIATQFTMKFLPFPYLLKEAQYFFSYGLQQLLFG